MIIDCHLHLDVTVDGTVTGAVRELNQQLETAGIHRAIVLHLETQPWTAEEVALAISGYPRLRGFINIHPYAGDAIQQLHKGLDMGFIGLKLHPRLQEFDINNQLCTKLVREAGKLNIPVLIDAFPDGTHLMQGFSPLKYAILARDCSETKIIVAHMGGHYVLDFVMLAKRVPNIFMDFSYSLLYYKNSPTTDNMVYAMRSMNFERIFYGSDYPDRPISPTLELSFKALEGRGIKVDELKKIMSENAINFFKWNDL